MIASLRKLLARTVRRAARRARSFDPKQLYTYRLLRWSYQVIMRHKLLITYNVNPDRMTFDENIFIRKMSKAQVYSLGYIRGKKMKDELKYLPFTCYVKFSNAAQPAFPVTILDDSGESYPCYETSSTLYDRYKSRSEELFMKGITTKTSISGGDMKTLAMIAIIAAVAIVGIIGIMMM